MASAHEARRREAWGTWLAVGVHGARRDANDLPEVWWSEANRDGNSGCYVDVREDGIAEWVFMQAPQTPTWASALRGAMRMLVLFVAWCVIFFVPVGVFSIFNIVMVVWLFAAAWLAYSKVLPLVEPHLRRLTQTSGAPVVERRSWADLQAFRLSNSSAETGHPPRTDSKGRQIAPYVCLFAEFGPRGAPVTLVWSEMRRDDGARLHQLLHLGFIERRAEDLARISGRVSAPSTAARPGPRPMEL